MDPLTEPIIQLPAALALMAWTAVSVLRFVRYFKEISNSSAKPTSNPGGADPGEWRGRMGVLVETVAGEIQRHRQVERDLTTVMGEVKGVLRKVREQLELSQKKAEEHYDEMRDVHRIITKESKR